LGILALILPQNEVSGPVLPQNMVLPQNEVYRTVLPLNEVGTVLWNGVFKFIFEVVLEMNKTILPQSSIVTVNCQLSKIVENSVHSLLNIGDKFLKFLTSAVTHSGENW